MAVTSQSLVLPCSTYHDHDVDQLVFQKAVDSEMDDGNSDDSDEDEEDGGHANEGDGVMNDWVVINHRKGGRPRPPFSSCTRCVA